MPRILGRQTQEKAETNLTSMLDLIFNVLAFFVVTFQPPEPEANFDYILPPPKEQPDTKVVEPDPFTVEPEDYNSVSLQLVPDDQGRLKTVLCDGRAIVPRYKDGKILSNRLINDIKRVVEKMAKDIKQEDGTVLESADIIADKRVKYAYVIMAVQALHQANIHKINFGGGEKGAQ